MSDEPTAELAEIVRKLMALGMLWQDISWYAGIPVPICQSFVLGAQWPKLVTRIEEDGTWEIVRCL